MKHKKDMKAVNVTPLVDFQLPDDEALPLTKCLCGLKFKAWDFIVPMYDDDGTEINVATCPNCGARLFFKYDISVYNLEIK